ncbi:serine/threonine-protein kinase CTR1-like isoform X1 [Cotesia glomerata]|uniref:serine/threonine-protein kinase CTR1-like isoform X1 n=1 Tax=Cotesia glomerata TaxID=32391 RepID=UPI001D014515|nr:serine/threonine-protein kinase CTR1-like isoform X1 [Cotesia glomerata]
MKNSQLLLFLLSTSEAKKDKNNNVKPQQVPTSRVQMRSTISSSKRGCRSKIHFSVNQQGSSVISLKSKDSAVNVPNKEPSKPTRVESPLLQPSTCEGEENFSVPTIEEHDLEFTGTTLGQGAFGCVKLAFWNGSEVAVKCLNANDNIKYLIREIKAMDLVRHPNIISIMSVCFTDLHTHIVMEYFKSITLTKYISNISTILDYPVKKNRNYFISHQICKAVAYMHGLNPNILHKDIKPDNILINQELLVKLCDLGLSKIGDLPSSLNTTIGRNFHGTPVYMPPEILILNEPGTTHSDVWSMACCIVELFSEEKIWEVLPIFTIPNLRSTILKLKKPKALNNVPLIIRDQLSQCFEHEPLKRPNALMLLQLFRRLYKESPDNTK